MSTVGAYVPLVIRSSIIPCNFLLSTTDRFFLSFWTIFCPFTPLWTQKIKFWKNEKNTGRYYHFANVYHKWQPWCMVPEIWHAMDRIFCHFGLVFALSSSPNNPKNQNFEKMKKLPGDIITLHMCTINNNHMMYGSWDMEHGRQNFLSFSTIFCTFTPLITRKIKILKKQKNHLEKLSLYTCVP